MTKAPNKPSTLIGTSEQTIYSKCGFYYDQREGNIIIFNRNEPSFVARITPDSKQFDRMLREMGEILQAKEST